MHGFACKVLVFTTTKSPFSTVSPLAIGKMETFCPTLDNINTTKAGEVLSVGEDGRVLVKISISEGSELEW